MSFLKRAYAYNKKINGIINDKLTTFSFLLNYKFSLLFIIFCAS